MSSFDSAAGVSPTFTTDLSGDLHIPALNAALVNPPLASDEFVPPEPATMEDTGLSANDLEALILNLLRNNGPTLGRKISDQIRLPFGLVTEQLRLLRMQLLLTLSNNGAMGDFEYDLTEEGRLRASRHAERCTYCGAAPVPMEAYVTAVEKQSLRKIKVRLNDVCRALSDLVLPPATLSQLGQAVHAGRGMFLYGKPGNGKTSIAERLIAAVVPCLWIPRTIAVGGEFIRLFDPANHREAPLTTSPGSLLGTMRYDRRWVRIRRPLIVVGGELRLEQLEITHNATTGMLESALQLKSNCGAFVVDDFGRQRCTSEELLNRWIVPLEKGYDNFTLPSGRQIQLPFDQLLIFSTNVPPQELVDEAFLRRIGYKIEVADPTPREYRDLWQQWCQKLGLEFQAAAVDHLFETYYQPNGRPLRYCHPRDLAQQVVEYCEFQDLPLVLTTKAIDVAAKNYFAGL
jgi:predicted ATPase with chaperone activity